MKKLLILAAALSSPLLHAQESIVMQDGNGAGAAPAPVMQLPLAEQRVRAGLILLNGLHETLAGIRDRDTADAAVAPLMRLQGAMQEWAQSFTALPPLSEQEQQAYEEQYLPLFKKLNGRIRSQGERLAAAEYYGSRDLPAVLIRLALLNQ